MTVTAVSTSCFFKRRNYGAAFLYSSQRHYLGEAESICSGNAAVTVMCTAAATLNAIHASTDVRSVGKIHRHSILSESNNLTCRLSTQRRTAGSPNNSDITCNFNGDAQSTSLLLLSSPHPQAIARHLFGVAK